MDQSLRDRQFRGWLAEAVEIVSRELCRSRPRIIATQIEREAAVLTVDEDPCSWTITVKVRPDRRFKKWSIRRTSAAWHLRKADESESLRSDFYALVDFASDLRRVYVVPGATVAGALRSSDQEWHRQNPKHQPAPDRWLASDYAALDQSLPGYPAAWLERYSDQWDLLPDAPLTTPEPSVVDHTSKAPIQGGSPRRERPEAVPRSHPHEPDLTEAEFDDLLDDFARNFFGYGDRCAAYWLIGIGEGGGCTRPEVQRRLLTWERRGRRPIEDAREFHEAAQIEGPFDAHPKINPTWGKLIHLLQSINGVSPDRDQVRHFQAHQLGRPGGTNCLLEIGPLPSPRTQRKNWHFDEWTNLHWMATPDACFSHYVSERAATIKAWVDQYKPAVVVFYSDGPAYQRWWESITGRAFAPTSLEGCSRIVTTDTLFIRTWHPIFRRPRSDDNFYAAASNDYFKAVGELIARESVEQLARHHARDCPSRHELIESVGETTTPPDSPDER